MSNWTSIHASVVVDLGNAPKWDLYSLLHDDIKDKEYTLLYDAKLKGNGFEIAGSEMNATVTVTSLSEHTLDPRNRYYLGGEYVVTVTGSLRDRLFEDTLAEWDRFARRLANFVLRDCARYDNCASDPDNTVRSACISSFAVEITGWSHKDNCYKRYRRSRTNAIPTRMPWNEV